MVGILEIGMNEKGLVNKQYYRMLSGKWEVQRASATSATARGECRDESGQWLVISGE